MEDRKHCELAIKTKFIKANSALSVIAMWDYSRDGDPNRFAFDILEEIRLFKCTCEICQEPQDGSR